ncbi:MAG: DJ-1 family protein [Desulfotalea sp.]|nr:MAG: DJ-1 family protein [Desulfotalea sp.]
MEKKVLVPLAAGFEMVEALSVVDVFRRAGVHVDLVAVADELQVISSHGVPVLTDKYISDCTDVQYDLIVLPGGIPGAEILAASQPLAQLLRKQNDAGRFYAAICAAPALVLGSQGLLDGKNATCHPVFAEQLPSQQYTDQSVVVDKNCITARGAGASIEFSLKLLEVLIGEDKRDEVAKQMALV